MFIFDINQYVQSDATLIALSGLSQIIIHPAVGYGDETAPLILWWLIPGLTGIDIDNWRKDRLRYMVMDNQADRCIAIAERMIKLLSVGPKIRTLVNSSDSEGKFCFLAAGEFGAPATKEGWYRYRLDFDISWTPKS